VELDGCQHVESLHDKYRDRWLRSQGFRIIRFWNDEVTHHCDDVLDAIYDAVTGRDSI